jgi:pSer/pThr/pTyr-binding forkhead associated (FHA) protein
MPANKCSNSGCEYFNRPLPNNMECCPGCGRPLGNVIASPPPSTPPPADSNFVSHPQVQPRQPPQQQIPSENTNYQPRSPYIPATPPSQPPRPVRPLLKLIHTTTGREFRFPGEEGYIGRRSQIHGTVPEIDLAGIPDEGVVSRSHARIFWDWNQNSYMILDTSRNGCYLNGNPLSQGVNHRLSNSDSLQLGQEGLVRFTVIIQ